MDLVRRLNFSCASPKRRDLFVFDDTVQRPNPQHVFHSDSAQSRLLYMSRACIPALVLTPNTGQRGRRAVVDVADGNKRAGDVRASEGLAAGVGVHGTPVHLHDLVASMKHRGCKSPRNTRLHRAAVEPDPQGRASVTARGSAAPGRAFSSAGANSAPGVRPKTSSSFV